MANLLMRNRHNAHRRNTSTFQVGFHNFVQRRVMKPVTAQNQKIFFIFKEKFTFFHAACSSGKIFFKKSSKIQTVGCAFFISFLNLPAQIMSVGDCAGYAVFNEFVEQNIHDREIRHRHERFRGVFVRGSSLEPTPAAITIAFLIKFHLPLC